MSDPKKSEAGSRPRGRARGRARPPPVEARPGEEPRPVEGAAAAPPPAPMGAGGRQMHRGVPRSDVPRPGEGQAGGDLAQRMEGLSVQPRATPAVGRASRRYEVEDVLRTRPDTKEPHVKQAIDMPEMELLTNYFELQSRPKWTVYQYHVEFSPVVESSRMRRALLGDHREVLGSCYLFDGMSDLKMVVKLHNEVTELYSQRRTDGETIRLQIKFTNSLAPNNPQLGHLFNTQMRRNLQHLNFKLIGRHYFDPNAVTNKDSLRLQIWQGIFTSIRMQETKLMMNVDTVHKIVRQQTAREILSELSREASNQEFRNFAAKALVGSVVMTMYNNRTYTIEEITWDENPEATFQARSGEISYMQYYLQQYDIRIRDRNQPLLLCTSKEREVRGGASQSKKVKLIPELCFMTGLTDSMRSNFTTMKEIATVTKLDPQQRVNNLRTFIRRVNSNQDVQREMGAWNLSFSSDLVKLHGHSLPPEEIIQQNSRSKYDRRTADFSREMRGKPMHSAVPLSSWIVICTRRDQQLCGDFLRMLDTVCRPMGMMNERPEVIHVENDRIGSYSEAFKSRLKQGVTKMVVFIVPNNKKDRYDALKKLTCIDHPVPSQVIVGRTLMKKQMLMSVATKIGIQLNCKMGGEPWCVNIPFKTPVMVIGYDTYHDANQKSRSAGGFVASMNSTFTRWYSRVNFHNSGYWQELSDHLDVNLTEALRKFNELNRTVPKMIIFYRDGIGDGQIHSVLEWEVKQMLSCINRTIPGGLYGPNNAEGTKVAFIVVNKRISTRFFAAEGNRVINPPPGTTVDNDVTRYERYDFFLVSQSVRQGTVAPTMYNIIKDHSGLRPSHMQRLAYKLTHLYFNWPGTIRVPAPCQYAHKLAFLSGQSLHRAPHESLSDKLFYL